MPLAQRQIKKQYPLRRSFPIISPFLKVTVGREVKEMPILTFEPLTVTVPDEGEAIQPPTVPEFPTAIIIVLILATTASMLFYAKNRKK